MCLGRNNRDINSDGDAIRTVEYVDVSWAYVFAWDTLNFRGHVEARVTYHLCETLGKCSVFVLKVECAQFQVGQEGIH